jgi:hypothetical protein
VWSNGCASARVSGVFMQKSRGVQGLLMCKVLLILLEYCKELVDSADGSP